MRRSTFLKFSATFLCATTLSSTSVFAADAGTYRPGNAYHSMTAASPDVCEMQCSGDAQCRSWNFVRISERAEGVCEFNENMSSPVASAISISGNNVSRARSTKVIAGQTNTVRVGAPSVTQAPAQKRVQTEAKRQIVRQQPPQTKSPQVATHRAPMPPASAGRSTFVGSAAAHPVRAPHSTAAAVQFRHSLEEVRPTSPVAAAPRTGPQSRTARSNVPASYSHADPRLQRQLQQQRQSAPAIPANQRTNTPSAPSYQPYSPPTAPASYAAASGGLSAPPGVPPLAPQTPTPNAAPTYHAPTMAGAPAPVAPRRVSIPSELSPRPMGASDSIFGSLYDDVKVPRPVDPALTSDPEAPIATVSSVPVAKITSGALPTVR